MCNSSIDKIMQIQLIAQEPKKCSVKCEVVQMMLDAGKTISPYTDWHIFNSHCGSPKKLKEKDVSQTFQLLS